MEIYFFTHGNIDIYVIVGRIQFTTLEDGHLLRCEMIRANKFLDIIKRVKKYYGGHNIYF